MSGYIQDLTPFPMLSLVMPVFALAIVPIVVIESIYLARKLGIPGKVAGKTVTTSNLISTIIGIPLTWALVLLIQFAIESGSAYEVESILDKILAVLKQAAWLRPSKSAYHWMVPVAGLILLIPFFFVSWWSEYFVSKKMLKNVEPGKLKKYVRNANLITYGLLALLPAISLATL